MLRSILLKASVQYANLTNPTRQVVAYPKQLLHQSYNLKRAFATHSPEKNTPETEGEDNSQEEFGNELKYNMNLGMYPDKNISSLTINGKSYLDLPIVHIKSSSNNTIISVTEVKGKVIAIDSGGSVGFRNVKKGTNIAAQAAALSVSQKILERGIKIVRVNMKGIGPGRNPALKGLQMAGIQVVSVTDSTPIPFNGNRPRKPRRL
ncbi:hypothetical protein SNE40_005097 [Patella caerulea]|uniref:Mitochondrial ribosomal protein S11 n=1 Tax=Patella caerulea TaxID=87958 RepID=A0AAN8K4C0_PATCE